MGLKDTLRLPKSPRPVGQCEWGGSTIGIGSDDGRTCRRTTRVLSQSAGWAANPYVHRRGRGRCAGISWAVRTGTPLANEVVGTSSTAAIGRAAAYDDPRRSDAHTEARARTSRQRASAAKSRLWRPDSHCVSSGVTFHRRKQTRSVRAIEIAEASSIGPDSSAGHSWIGRDSSASRRANYST